MQKVNHRNYYFAAAWIKMKKAYLRIDVSCYNGCHIAKSKTRTAAYTLAFKSSSLVLFPELVWFLLHKHKHKHKYIWICDHLKIFVIQVTESAKFDICDIRGGFDTGRLFLNNNLEHKRSDHIWTLSTMRSFLFGIINSFTDRQLRQSLTKKKVYRIPVQ